jgi:hypothetical protein
MCIQVIHVSVNIVTHSAKVEAHTCFCFGFIRVVGSCVTQQQGL